MSTEMKTTVRAISAKALTSHGYAVCLFPEQPARQVIVEEISSSSNAETEEVQEELRKISVVPLEATTKPLAKVRLYWRNRLVYLLAFISFSLSMNNVYNFPMQIYRYGENFFIPYTIATIIVGYPMLVLQTSMGQYGQLGSLWIWECAPLFFGVGCAMLTACLAMSLYYNIFAAYALVYFAHCFNAVLPWIYCSRTSMEKNHTCVSRLWYVSENVTLASKDYFYDVVLNTPHRYPEEVWSFTHLKWWLFVSLFFSWILVYFVTLRSSHSIGKMAVFTVIFAYFAMLTLLVVAFQVRSSGKLSLRTEKTVGILDARMWVAATMQVLLELGIPLGVPVMYGSYCRFRNHLLTDSIILCAVNYLHSLIFFYLFFSYLRSFSCVSWDLPDHSIAVIYVIYSELFSTLSGSHMWCLTFFFMLFLIVIGTQVAVTECIMAAIYEKFRRLAQYRWLLNLLICFSFFLLGIGFCFTNGYFGALLYHSIPSLFITIPLACLFLFGIIFTYDFKNYSKNMKLMLNYDLNAAVKVCLWALVILLVLAFIVLVLSVDSAILRSSDEHGMAGWFITGVIIYPVFLCGVLWTAYSVIVHKKLLRSTIAWVKLEEEKKKEDRQFSSDYSSSYTWEWNKYQPKKPVND